MRIWCGRPVSIATSTSDCAFSRRFSIAVSTSDCALSPLENTDMAARGPTLRARAVHGAEQRVRHFANRRVDGEFVPCRVAAAERAIDLAQAAIAERLSQHAGGLRRARED